MSNRVLVVEDEPDMAAIIVYALREGGFEARHAANAEEAALGLLHESFDLLIVDIGLPGRSGFELCRDIRRRSYVPIMILTAHAEAEDRIIGFESCADDYVPKPFHPRELVLRARAILTRSSQVGRADLQVGRLAIDMSSSAVLVDGKDLSLSRIEFRLLVSLARQPGTVMSVKRLLDEVWGSEQRRGGKDLLKATVYRLRKTLSGAGLPPDLIVAQRGQGYMLSNSP